MSLKTYVDFIVRIVGMNDTITSINVFNSTGPKRATEPASVLQRTPIAGAHAHYRSLTFTAQTGINPLIAAAAPLLALNARLKQAEQANNNHRFYQALVHEMNAFETNAQNRGYHAEAILIARYALCATLDETLNQLTANQAHPWEHKLLSVFQREQGADERFFIILERLHEDSAQHVELLELIYLCLSYGFSGKFRHQTKGNTSLDGIIDDVYQRIRHHRHEPKNLVYPQPQLHYDTNTTPNYHAPLWLTALKTTLATAAICATLYGGFAYLFNAVTQPVQQHIKTLPQPNHQQNPAA